jgi:serine/threonine protein kinase
MSRGYLVNSNVGEYRLVAFLGAGGMGEVYRAEHNKIGRVAAVKVLTQATDPGFVERFFNEARIQASLQHPNIATLYDFLELNGQPCIIMEYIDGITLAERIRPYGALPVSEALNIFYHVVEAINYIHQHGIIHRDIKSNNIKISSTGQVKLLDFGIAKGQTSPGLTATGSVIGTLEYMSPEQLKGGHADARSDIWALGVLLYETMTGHVPFESQTIGELCDKIDKVQYPPPAQFNPSIPREVANVIARCLRRNPAERYQTAQELLEDVRRLFSIVAAQAANAERQKDSSELKTPQTEKSFASRYWLPLLGGASLVALFLIFAAGGGAYWMMSGDDANDANAALNQTPKPSANNAAANNTRITNIVLSPVLEDGGQAEVWRNGEKIGMTPYQYAGKMGEHVELILKHPGYQDYKVVFDVTNKPTYSVTMKKIEASSAK